MLSYRHLYHAGNFADVFKHTLLSRLLIALGSKDKPFLYLDTHAGIGRYDLGHAWAQKACEYENGIARVWRAADAPEPLRPYLEFVQSLNPEGQLRIYPGSPVLARHFLRPDDRLVLVELNKADHAELANQIGTERNVAVQLMDAYQSLTAYLPPPERRGLVLIDSAFDVSREFDRLLKAIKHAHTRWNTGVYAIWYPLMEPATIRDFHASLARSGIRKILKAEIEVRERDESGIIPGCGMLVINSPWHFDDEARAIVPWLAQRLRVSGAGASRVEWLVPE